MILIPMLIKALLATRNPALCAAIYGAALFTNGVIFDLALNSDWMPIFGRLALSTTSALVFFWLLMKAEDTGPPYWAVLIIGVALMVFVVP
jgi:ABC-type cobalamin transport system permease subunit